jgi:hypothetical protein
MDTKDVKIDCPCCGSHLEVDVRTSKIVRWRKKGETDETGKPVMKESDWGAATDRVSKRMGTAADKFDESLTREKSRSKDLDELFRKASEKLDRKDGGELAGMRFGRIALRSFLVLAVLAAGDWLLGRLVLADGWFLGRPVAPFDPPLFSPSQVRVLAQIESDLATGQPRVVRFDPELGWCNKPESGHGEFRYDWAGARIGDGPLVHVKPAGVRRVVAVGCSMTHGEEVSATESWCARVDTLLSGVEVANLGVAAYGLDQALLRLRRDGWPLAPDEVWLGVLPQAALRVTTRFRPLLDHWSLDVAFKPRFVLDASGELVLVPNPAASLADVVRLLHDQRAFLDALDDDPWIARARLAYAPRGSSWTHRSFAARLLETAWERTGRHLEECFDPGTEFGRLYTTIVRAMASECAGHGAIFRLILLPGQEDLRRRAREGQGYWEGWTASLEGEGVFVIDLAPVLERAGVAQGRLFGPGGHYTSEGSEIVARGLVEQFAE